jgi:deoxyribonuclease V
VFVATPRIPEPYSEPGWAAAVLFEGQQLVDEAGCEDVFEADYASGLLALRQGAILEHIVRNLRRQPDVLLVNASGRDHPRRAGLAVHLGAACDVPTIGITDRPLLASGEGPPPQRHAVAPLLLDGEIVGYRLRTLANVRPIVVHAGWRVDAATACEVIKRLNSKRRTPEPLREARRLARTDRAQRRSR